MAETGKYRSEYFNSVGIPVLKFQEEGVEEHHVRWTGGNELRNRGEGRADWVWVWHRAINVEANGKVDGRTIGSLQGLFRVQDKTDSFHKVAIVRLLRLKGSGRPHSEEGMIRMQLMDRERGFHVIRIADNEGMAHLIPLEKNRVWLVNNRIDFNTWNELYE